MEPVVVTGVGAVTPLGVGAGALHERWVAGVCGIRDGEGACADFDPRDFLSAKEARRSDRFAQLAIAACREALDDAGWGQELPYDASRVGCVLGTGIGGIATLVESQDTLRERGREFVSPLSVPLMMSNAGAAALSMRHGFRGPTMAVSSACASAAHALGFALRMLQHGEADARRDGFVMGEGAAVLVMERASVARDHGRRILGTIRGYGASSDAHHLTAPRETGEGQAAAMLAALADAGAAATDVDYVNAHGTSTPLNDRAETCAIKLALGEHAASIPVSSTKSTIGHLLGAAGAVEAVATLLALRDRIAPPTLGLVETEDGLDLDYVPNAARPLPVSGTGPALALSNSFGFGGHNAVLCLEAA